MHPWSAGWWLVSNELKPLLYHARHSHILREAELLADRVHLGLAGQLPARDALCLQAGRGAGLRVLRLIGDSTGRIFKMSVLCM